MMTKTVKSWICDIVVYIIGSVIFAIGINSFIAPNNLAPGGLTGIGTMANYLFAAPIGMVILICNIPLFLWAYFSVGLKFIAKTIVASVISSITIDISAKLLPVYNGDMMLTTVYAGILLGVGLSIIFIRGGTTGGTDLAANLLTKKLPHIPLGQLMLAIDFVVVIISAFIYKNIETPLYSIITIFIMSKAIDAILYGTSRGNGKLMYIISNKNNEIANKIIERLERGVTALKSRGVFTDNEGEVLLCAVRRHEVYKTYDIIRSIDPNAFIIVGEAGEITGEGFNGIIATK